MEANNEPIRESLTLLISKIAVILISTDLIYAIVNYFLLQAFFLNHQLPLNLHESAPILLTVLHLAKTAFQVWAIATAVFRWVGNSYQITDKHLVHREGIMNSSEKIYDLNIIRSISNEQTWLGKIFHYGTVHVEISASGGYSDQVALIGVNNPEQYEKMLRRHF